MGHDIVDGAGHRARLRKRLFEGGYRLSWKYGGLMRTIISLAALVIAACTPEPEPNAVKENTEATTTRPALAEGVPVKDAPSPDAAVVGDAEEQGIGARLSNDYHECLARVSGSDSLAEVECIGAEHERQDAALNATYRAVMTRLRPAQKASLRQLQRDWLASFEDQCAEKAEETMTAQTVISKEVECKLTETVRRTIWLENY